MRVIIDNSKGHSDPKHAEDGAEVELKMHRIPVVRQSMKSLQHNNTIYVDGPKVKRAVSNNGRFLKETASSNVGPRRPPGNIGQSVIPPVKHRMTADRMPTALGAKVNECLKLGSGQGHANGRLWVVTPTGHSLKEATRQSV